VDIAQERIETQAVLRDLVAQQFSEGLATRQQLDQADAALAQLRSAQAPLRASLEATRNALDVLLGNPAGTSRQRFAQAAPVPSAPPVGAEETPAQLLRRRPDLIAAERRVAAANARIGQAIAEYYPKVSLSALIGSASTSGAQFLGDSAAQVQGVLGLRWRLFDFGRVDAGIAAARGQSAEALLVYKLVALRATEEVETSLSELDQRRAQSRLLADGTAHATAAREATQRSVSMGLSSRLELLRAQDQVLQFRDAQVQADAAGSFAAIAAYRALGGGWCPGEPLVEGPDAPSIATNAR
jgi:outer membrane protein TolC